MSKAMSTTMEKKTSESSWNTRATYEKVNSDITNEWPRWKKEVYNDTFAVSAHAAKIVIRKG